MINSELVEELMVRLTNNGFCSSRRSPSWRVVNRPNCPLRVQLEFGLDEVDIVPLSAYTETLETGFPLADQGIPHTQRIKFNSREDIDTLIASVKSCFPR